MTPSLRFPFSFDAQRLKADLSQFTTDEWVLHFNKPYYQGEWSGIALRSIGGETGRLYPDPTAQLAFADTPELARCPYIGEILQMFQCPLEAVRFLKLASGSRIREHKDYNLGFEDGEIRIHIPVVTDPAVEFYLDGERLDMREGEAWYLDLNRPHRVVNLSPVDRVHLVVDVILTDWVRAFFPEAERETRREKI